MKIQREMQASDGGQPQTRAIQNNFKYSQVLMTPSAPCISAASGAAPQHPLTHRLLATTGSLR